MNYSFKLKIVQHNDKLLLNPEIPEETDDELFYQEMLRNYSGNYSNSQVTNSFSITGKNELNNPDQGTSDPVFPNKAASYNNINLIPTNNLDTAAMAPIAMPDKHEPETRKLEVPLQESIILDKAEETSNRIPRSEEQKSNYLSLHPVEIADLDNSAKLDTDEAESITENGLKSKTEMTMGLIIAESGAVKTEIISPAIDEVPEKPILENAAVVETIETYPSAPVAPLKITKKKVSTIGRVIFSKKYKSKNATKDLITEVNLVAETANFDPIEDTPKGINTADISAEDEAKSEEVKTDGVSAVENVGNEKVLLTQLPEDAKLPESFKSVSNNNLQCSSAKSHKKRPKKSKERNAGIDNADSLTQSPSDSKSSVNILGSDGSNVNKSDPGVASVDFFNLIHNLKMRQTIFSNTERMKYPTLNDPISFSNTLETGFADQGEAIAMEILKLKSLNLLSNVPIPAYLRRLGVLYMHAGNFHEALDALNDAILYGSFT